MHLYEIILDIIVNQGPMSIPSIVNEMNVNPRYKAYRENAVKVANIKSALSRKKDLFIVNNEIVFIHPNRELISMTIVIITEDEASFKLKIDFNHNRFYIFEWLSRENKRDKQIYNVGSIDEFKRDLYRINIWNWNLTQDLNHKASKLNQWNLELETEGTRYEISGESAVPNEWNKFCRSISKLIGKKVC